MKGGGKKGRRESIQAKSKEAIGQQKGKRKGRGRHKWRDEWKEKRKKLKE